MLSVHVGRVERRHLKVSRSQRKSTKNKSCKEKKELMEERYRKEEMEEEVF